MKFTTSFLVFFFFCTLNCFAQEADGKGEIIFKELSPTEKTTMIVNIEGYDMNNVGALKDELLGYEEKVTNVKINDKLTQMFVTYSGNMLREDLIRAFEKHRISYRISPSSTTPIENSKE